jgi:hypothetical protein
MPSNDDIAGVPASVDDGAMVTRGGVVEVTAPLPVRRRLHGACVGRALH